MSSIYSANQERGKLPENKASERRKKRNQKTLKFRYKRQKSIKSLSVPRHSDSKAYLSIRGGFNF